MSKGSRWNPSIPFARSFLTQPARLHHWSVSAEPPASRLFRLRLETLSGLWAFAPSIWNPLLIFYFDKLPISSKVKITCQSCEAFYAYLLSISVKIFLRCDCVLFFYSTCLDTKISGYSPLLPPTHLRLSDKCLMTESSESALHAVGAQILVKWTNSII